MAGRRTAFARAQRQSAGLAETRVWDRVRGGKVDGLRFRRQHPIGPWCVDFACVSLRLIIEIDGGVHRLESVALRDAIRQSELESMGWTVIRFTNDEAMGQMERLVDTIREHASLFRRERA